MPDALRAKKGYYTVGRTLPKELKGFTETRLTHGQNRVVTALRAAVKLITRAV
jgi:hypothetical protein